VGGKEEVDVANFKVLSCHIPRGTKGKQEQW
jgi:hypothetical protein